MSISIVEIKARCHDHDFLRRKLNALNPDFKGEDHQIDTYFKVPEGRLKLRRGNIENTLIYYGRPNTTGPKLSNVELYKPVDAQALYNVLSSSLEILVEVNKVREIYFIDNVKFHIDTVQGLGTFMEIEAIDETDTIDKERLRAQCELYIRKLEVSDGDLIDRSYSDLLLEKC